MLLVEGPEGLHKSFILGSSLDCVDGLLGHYCFREEDRRDVAVASPSLLTCITCLFLHGVGWIWYTYKLLLKIASSSYRARHVQQKGRGKEGKERKE